MYHVKTIAVIPARGGSKGIPRKNLQPLVGKPLIAHTIEQAQRVNLVDRVVVSTDDQEIGDVAHRYGAEVVWRPREISGDLASSESALLHALGHLKEAEAYQPDLLVFLQCTAPLALAEDIDGTIQALLDQDADSALAVAPFHYFLWRHDEHGDAVGVNHDKRRRLLRQEQEELQYVEAGAVYVMRTPGFLEARHRFFGKTALYVMPPARRLEIDEPVDFQVAEVLMRERQKIQKQQLLESVALLVLDFDGVLTDNGVWVDEEGREAVRCHRGDGIGIELLRQAGIDVIVLSKEKNPVVTARCRKLDVPCIQGLDTKLATLQSIVEERPLGPDRVAYVGNDINDLECLGWVGLPIAVADAVPQVKSSAQLITTQPGGHGAVREICDLILATKDNV